MDACLNKGLSNLVNKIEESESTNDTEKASLSETAANPKNRVKRKAAMDTRAKAKVPVDGTVRDVDLPQTSARKKPRPAAKKVVVVDNTVPDINDVQSWSDGLIESWDDCVFTLVPKETQRSVPSSERVAAVESDPEDLPSNQEAYRRESQHNIDNQHIIGLIQDSVKIALSAFEVRFNERLDALERRLDAYTTAAEQQHGIWIKQVIAAQQLHSGAIQQVARNQSLMADLLKQVALLLYLIQIKEDMNRSESTTGTLVELLNIMRSMSDEDPEPNSDFEHLVSSHQSGEGSGTRSHRTLNPAPN